MFGRHIFEREKDKQDAVAIVQKNTFMLGIDMADGKDAQVVSFFKEGSRDLYKFRAVDSYNLSTILYDTPDEAIANLFLQYNIIIKIK